MARQLKAFPCKYAHKMPSKKYDRYMNFKPWEFKKGIDFTISPHNHRMILQEQARIRGLRSTTSVIEDCVYFQAIKVAKKKD